MVELISFIFILPCVYVILLAFYKVIAFMSNITSNGRYIYEYNEKSKITKVIDKEEKWHSQ